MNQDDIDNCSIPIVQAIEAAAKTIANPSLPVLIEDLVLVHRLAGEIKQQLKDKHPSLSLLFTTLFHMEDK